MYQLLNTSWWVTVGCCSCSLTKTPTSNDGKYTLDMPPLIYLTIV